MLSRRHATLSLLTRLDYSIPPGLQDEGTSSKIGRSSLRLLLIQEINFISKLAAEDLEHAFECYVRMAVYEHKKI